MQPILLIQIQKSLCNAFPQIDFAIMSLQNELVFVHAPNQLLTKIPPDDLPKIPSATIHGVTWYTRWFPLPGVYSLCMLTANSQENYHDFDSMIKALIHQLALQVNDETPQNNNALFFYHLLHKNTSTALNPLALLSSDTVYDFFLPRVICVIDLRLPDAPASRQTTLDTLDFIRHYPFIKDQDITGFLCDSQLVICKALPPDHYPIRACCEKLFAPLLEAIRLRFSLSPRIGIGFLVQRLEDYPFSLRSASSILATQPDLEDTFLYAIDQLPHLLMDSIPSSTLSHYFEEYARLLQKHADWADTLDALVTCNMDPGAAAASLYLHKNSLSFRLRHMLQSMHLEPLQSDQTKYFLILLHTYCRRIASET